MQSNFNFTTWLTLPWADAADTAESYFRSTNNLSLGVDPLQLESQLKSNLSLLIKKAVQAARLLKSRNEAPLPRSSIFASTNNNNNNQHQVQIDRYLYQNHGGLSNQQQQEKEKDESHALDVYLRFLKYALENNNSDGTLIVLFAADDFKALKQLKPVFSECLLDQTIAMWVDSRGTAPRRSGLGLLHCLADYSRFKEFIANEFFGSLFSFLVQSPPDVEHGPADDDFAARRVCAQVITAAIRSSKATKLFAVKNKLIDQIVPLVRDTPTGDFYLQLQCFEILYRVTRVETSKVLPRLELPELIRRSLEPGNTKLSDGDKFINNLIEILDVYNNQRVHQYNNNNNTSSTSTMTLLHSYRVNSYDIVLEEKFRADDKDPNAIFLARASANNTQIIFSSRNAVLLLPDSNGANHNFPLRQIAHFRISRDHTLCLGFKKIDQEFFRGFYGNTDSSIQSEEEFRNLEHAIMQRQVDQQQQQQQSNNNNNNESTTTRKKTFWISVSLSLDPTVGSEIREGPVQGWVKNAFERKKNFTSRTNSFKQQLMMMMMMTENNSGNNQQQTHSATGSRLPSPTPVQQQQQQQSNHNNNNNTRSANGSQQQQGGTGSFSTSSFGNHRDPNSFNNNNNNNANSQQQQKNQQQQQQSSAPPSLGNMFNFGGGNEMNNNNNNNSSSSSSFSNFAFLSNNNNNQGQQQANQNNNTSSFQQRPSCSRLSVSISQQRANSTTASSLFGQQNANTNNSNHQQQHQLFSSSAQQMYEMNRKQQQDKAKEMLKQCLEVVNARLDEVRKEDERDVQEYENWVKSETSALMGGLETSKKRAIEELTKLDSSVSSAFEGYKKFVGKNNNNNNNTNQNQQQNNLPDQLYSRQEIMEFAQDVAADLEKLHQLIEGTAQDTEQHYHDQVAQLKSELENSLQQCSDTIASISAESAMPEEFVRRFNLSSTTTTTTASA